MKLFYTFLAASALTAMPAMAQELEALPYSDYTGDGFTANWQGGDKARLTVFSVDLASSNTVVQDFGAVVRDGQINADEVEQLRPEWDVQTPEDATGNVSFVLGRDMLTLNGEGSSVALVSRHGFLKALRIKAYLINAEGITEQNSSRLHFDILYNDGSRLGMTGSTYAMVFASQNEFDFIPQFVRSGLSQISGIRVSVQKDDIHSVGDLAIDCISYDYHSREMFIPQMLASGGHVRVEQCDPSKAYFYYFSPEEGDAQTRIETVDGFLLPELQAPEITTTTSYKAKWGTPYKADNITVRNYKVTVFDEPAESFVLNEDFDSATEGTLELPSYTSDIDQFCNTPGWSLAGAAGRTVAGMIGTAGSPRPWPPMGGYMYSPTLDLSNCDGVYKLAFRLYGEAGDVITVYRDGSMTSDSQLYGHQFTFDDNGVIEEEYTMDDGVDGKSIRFESKGMKQFFIDYFRVSQLMPAGSKSYSLVSEAEIDGSATEHEFTGLDEKGLYAYALELTGKNLSGGDRTVKHEEYMEADLSQSGLEDVAYEAALPVVTASEGAVNVTVTADSNVSVYGFDGTLLGVAAVKGGASATIPVASGTPVIVRVGDTAVKLIVK